MRPHHSRDYLQSGVLLACEVASARGETVGREVIDELGEKARGRIEHFLSRKVEKGQIESFDIGLPTLATDQADLAECDVVIGAIAAEIERV